MKPCLLDWLCDCCTAVCSEVLILSQSAGFKLDDLTILMRPTLIIVWSKQGDDCLYSSWGAD